MSDCTHETVSFAVFLEYRARRLATLVPEVSPPEVVTTPPDLAVPAPIAVAAMLPWPVRV